MDTLGVLIAIMIIAGLIFLAWCIEPAEDGKVTLMYGFTPNVGYAPFYVASANGYYADEGLNVDFQYTIEGSVGVIKQIGAGKVEFGYAGDSAIIIGKAHDVEIVAVQRIIQNNLFGVYSKEELNITKPEDLIGKKIALPGPAVVVTTVTQIMLISSGIKFTKIEPLYVGGAIISTHLAGDADAFGAYLPQKIVAGEIGGEKMNEISASDYTTIGRTYLFTSDIMIQENPEIVKKFVNATQKGLEYSVEHPEEAVDAYIQYDTDAEEKRDLHLSIWNGMVERGFDKDVEGNPIFHIPSEDSWAEKQDQMFDVGAIDKKINVGLFYTDEFIPI